MLRGHVVRAPPQGDGSCRFSPSALENKRGDGILHDVTGTSGSDPAILADVGLWPITDHRIDPLSKPTRSCTETRRRGWCAAAIMTAVTDWDDDIDAARAPICPSCGVTALPAELANVIDTGFVCENPDCEAFGEPVEC